MEIGGKEKLEAFEGYELREVNWVIMETGKDSTFEASTSTIGSCSDNSINSIQSSSSSELLEDASSSSTSNLSLSSLSSSSSSSGPLYELSELMATLPIK